MRILPALAPATASPHWSGLPASCRWMYELGVNFMPSKRWQLFADFLADFNGGYALVLGPTFRF